MCQLHVPCQHHHQQQRRRVIGSVIGWSMAPLAALEAGDLEAGDLEAGDLEVGDLEVGDLEAGDLEAASRGLEETSWPCRRQPRQRGARTFLMLRSGDSW